MKTYNGKSVYKSVAIGEIFIYKKEESRVKRYHINDVAAEKQRLATALANAADQLAALYEKALNEVGEANAAIFEIHQMMLEDDDYLAAIDNIIEAQTLNAEYAVAATGDNFAEMFANMDDEYMQGRAADVRDISERVIRNLVNGGGNTTGFDKPVIIVADDLMPSETVQLDKTKVLAFVTRHGSANSHTAILARTMNIPALIGVDVPLNEALNGLPAVVDGYTGTLYIEPEPAVLQEATEKQASQAAQLELLATMRGQQSVTLDGQRVNLYANIGGVGDLAAVLQNDAEGIGLFRSEFMYLEKDTYPTENEQFAVYRKVLETMAGKKVVVRTLDIGADKQIDYFNLDKEDNPALGYRAIRICLDRKDVFITQLRALYRASVYGRLSIMFPMVISVAEVLEIKEIIAQVKAQLQAEQIPYAPNVEIGIMVETPAAAIISDRLAQHVDFFSIGTNDLSQYVLAIDRQNPKLDKSYNPHHTAILRAIKMTVDNGHKAGIWVGVCGELAADLTITKTLLSIGVDELSVSPGFLLGLRKAVRETDVAQVQQDSLALLG